MWTSTNTNVRTALLKTIQITLPEKLLAKVDRTVNAMHTNRSAFAREALELALKRYEVAAKERQDAEGYARRPQELDEIESWSTVQDWGDEWNA